MPRCVPPLSFGSTCEFHSADPAIRRKNIDEAKKYVDLAHDTGAWAVKVRPNGFAPELGPEKTIQVIGESLREVGDYAGKMGVEIWMEVHGRETQVPPVSAAIMRAAKHPSVGLCWNSNPTDIVNGSVKQYFTLLRPWIKNCHINELAGLRMETLVGNSSNNIGNNNNNNNKQQQQQRRQHHRRVLS